MKISELVAQLERVKSEVGDVPVVPYLYKYQSEGSCGEIQIDGVGRSSSKLEAAYSGGPMAVVELRKEYDW